MTFMTFTMDTMTLPRSPKNHLKRTHSDTIIETPLQDAIVVSPPSEAPVISTSDSGILLPSVPGQTTDPVTTPNPASPIMQAATTASKTTNSPLAPGGTTSTSINPLKKRTKLSESEKETKRQEREAKEQEKAKQKAKKEEEKVRKDGEKAKKDEERRVRDAEKEKKRREKEEQTRLKEDEKRKLEEKKQKVCHGLANCRFEANGWIVSNASQCLLPNPESRKRWIDCVIATWYTLACQQPS